jgi:hypothetical protein
MKPASKIVLVAAVVIAGLALSYLGITSIFGGSPPPETKAAEAAVELLKTQFKQLREQVATQKELVANATRNLQDAAAASTERARLQHLNAASGHLNLIASGQAGLESILKGIETSIETTTANSREAEQMRADLEELAVQLLGKPNRATADVLQRYRTN